MQCSISFKGKVNLDILHKNTIAFLYTILTRGCSLLIAISIHTYILMFLILTFLLKYVKINALTFYMKTIWKRLWDHLYYNFRDFLLLLLFYINMCIYSILDTHAVHRYIVNRLMLIVCIFKCFHGIAKVGYNANSS